jgi:hypothetical protein
MGDHAQAERPDAVNQAQGCQHQEVGHGSTDYVVEIKMDEEQADYREQTKEQAVSLGGYPLEIYTSERSRPCKQGSRNRCAGIGQEKKLHKEFRANQSQSTGTRKMLRYIRPGVLEELSLLDKIEMTGAICLQAGIQYAVNDQPEDRVSHFYQ